MSNFLPHTPGDRQAMIAEIGLKDPEQLFDDIPASLRQQATLSVIPRQGYSELELEQELMRLSKENQGAGFLTFLGGGAYNRFIPPAVNTIASRSEFATAYTPYQPEISQGTLQVIYEFQSMIAELTGMDVANASVYDAATAVSEAAFMALRLTKRHRILISNTAHPDSRQVLKTYITAYGGAVLDEFDPSAGVEALSGLDFNQVACVIIQNPNYLGILEQIGPWQKLCEAHGSLLVIEADPISMGVLEAPGNYGADIVVGDIQPLGNNLAFGGPYGGFVATKSKYVRQLPGRLVGRTVDKNGKPCFSLTLQTREQHIRREKATSNICTNQALNVLKATVYLTLLGPQGLRRLAEISAQRAHALAKRLTRLDGVSLLFPEQPFLSEFALKLPVPVEKLLCGMEQDSILAGISLSRYYPQYENVLLVAVTERNTPADIDRYVQSFERHLNLILQGDQRMGSVVSKAAAGC